ncbi:hypothetical protein Godav_000109 [Gossypium davidsonii]|uniref:CCHC-type domain-containing protein n=1 Tax=Gossypium davidsonii TaxID=34287 RepID=A0A7J8TJL0_GOSDV|nr:hypothetical protein [Gossypium davidsonii]
MAVYVDLEKPLVSHILINGRKQNVEYESLSTICFHCGRYGHVENSCPFKKSEIPNEKENTPSKMSSEFQNTAKVDAEKEYGNFGPWMIVEKKSRRKIRDNMQNSLHNQQIGKDGSRFRTLNNKDLHKDDFEGFVPNTRCHKGKEIMHGNSMEKISAIPNNDRIVEERNNNNKSNLKEAHGVLERSDSDLVAHHPSVAAGKGSRTFITDELQTVPGDDMGLGFEGERSKNQPDLEESRRTAVSLDVGNLDSGRHSAVVFHKNTQAKEKNNAHPSLVLSGGSGKSFKNKGRGFAKKQTKLLHGSNVRFKNSGGQRTPLKESMEFLAESISTFAKSNIEVDSSFKIGGQKEGVNDPGQ